MTLSDKQGRYFKSLRLSVTPDCNFACTYCADSEISTKTPQSNLLSPDELIRLVSAINPFLNLNSVRITGGEPTLYRHLPKLIRGLKTLGIPKVALTTNGVFLPPIVEELKTAGLSSINVSLDAIDPIVFSKLSRRNEHSSNRTLAGIEAAIKAGIFVKLNCTVMKGINDSQIMPLLDFSKNNNIPIRFLELMEMGPLCGEKHKTFYTSTAEILAPIQEKYTITEIPRQRSATAKYWKTEQGHHFGIIANYSHPFCSDCNRLRIDHTGRMYGCLSNSDGVSLLDTLNNGGKINDILLSELYKKQPVRFTSSRLSMKAIGG